MQLIAPAHVDSPFAFEFAEAGAMPNPLLRLHNTGAGYGDTTILSSLSFSLLPGERIGLLGANGEGKSTLIKLLAGEIAPLTGSYEAARDLKIGYFAQHQLEQLHGELSPLQHLMMIDEALSEREARNFLGGFDFRGDAALAPVAPFSGGEKARLALAMIVYRNPNLLLLDEPTNHLDLEMRHALAVALQSYEGAMILVSHDRHLLRSVCDSLMLVANGRAEPFAGDLDDYSTWLLEQRSALDADTPSEQSFSRKDERRARAEQRKALQPLRNRVKKLESQLETLHREMELLDEKLADRSLYESGNGDTLKALTIEHASVKQQVDVCEEAWMEASEALEEASEA